MFKVQQIFLTILMLFITSKGLAQYEDRYVINSAGAHAQLFSNSIDYVSSIGETVTGESTELLSGFLIPQDVIAINVHELNLNYEVALYPNPSTSYMYFSSNELLMNYRIYNEIGQCILKATITKTMERIDLSQFASGIYIINFMTKENKQISKKLILNNEN